MYLLGDGELSAYLQDDGKTIMQLQGDGQTATYLDSLLDIYLQKDCLLSM